MNDDAALDELLEPLRAEYHARRRKTLSRSDAIAQALERYNQALELAVAREIAAAHGLRTPRSMVDVADAARALLQAVQALPELQLPTPAADPKSLPAPSSEPAPVPMMKSGVPFAHLTQALMKSPLVVVGGSSPLSKSRIVPKELIQRIEWVDTRHQGTHAIGNLERRIREGRVSALILVEGMVQHRHTDPLVSAARAAQVPCAYAGKGGTLALKTALDEIEKALESNASPLPA